MAFEKRDNSGVLFKNDRKEKPSHADYTGTATIGGRDYFLNAWLKEGKKGKFFSFAFKPRDAQQTKAPTQREPEPDYDESEVPF